MCDHQHQGWFDRCSVRLVFKMTSLVLIFIMSSYLLNPYLFLPTLALSTSSFDNTLTLLSIMFACQGLHFSAKCHSHYLSFRIRTNIGVAFSPGLPYPPLAIIHFAPHPDNARLNYGPCVAFGISETLSCTSSQSVAPLGRVFGVLCRINNNSNTGFW
jgi:hypothetical protein